MLKNLLFLRFPILLLLLLITALTTILFTTPVNLNKFVPDPILNRLFSSIFTLALIILTYKWSIKLLDGWWALLPPFLLTFSANILSPNNTVDHYMAASFFYSSATYWLMKFFLKPSKPHLILTGLNFGLVQFSGFSGLILIPYFLILILVFYIASVKRDWLTTESLARFKRFGVRGLRYFRSIIVIFTIGYLFVYAFHFLLSLEQHTQKFKNSISLQETLLLPFNNYLKTISDSSNELISSIYNTRVIFPLKTYWPFIILIASAFIYSFINIIKSFRASKFKGFWDYLGTSFPEFSMIVFIIMYSLFIIFFTFGINVEKLIPILPMVYILTASGLKRLLMNKL